MGKNTGGGDDEPPPLRLWYPAGYALATWADWKAHGVYPRPGGYDAQDPALLADFQAITRRYNWHARQLQEEQGEGRPRERDMDVSAFVRRAGGGTARDWQDGLGE